MNPLGAELRIRRMTKADLDQVIELAESLKEAPNWSRSAYLAALDPEAVPLRIAAVIAVTHEGISGRNPQPDVTLVLFWLADCALTAIYVIVR
jgi:hypothetical protein